MLAFISTERWRGIARDKVQKDGIGGVDDAVGGGLRWHTHVDDPVRKIEARDGFSRTTVKEERMSSSSTRHYEVFLLQRAGGKAEAPLKSMRPMSVGTPRSRLERKVLGFDYVSTWHSTRPPSVIKSLLAASSWDSHATSDLPTTSFVSLASPDRCVFGLQSRRCS
jgi:hypothetical protein